MGIGHIFRNSFYRFLASAMTFVGGLLLAFLTETDYGHELVSLKGGQVLGYGVFIRVTRLRFWEIGILLIILGFGCEMIHQLLEWYDQLESGRELRRRLREIKKKFRFVG